MSVAHLFKSLFLFFIVTIQAACSIRAVHSSLKDADLPKQPPVRDFVANTDFNGNYRISPDGKKLSWNGVSETRSAIFWMEILELTQDNVEDKKATASYQKFGKYGPGPQWASDSRYLLYHFDPSGRENQHVFAIDTNLKNATPINLTHYEGVKAFISHIPRLILSEIFISHNRRDREVFDLYSINLDTGLEKILYQNNDNSSNFLLDDEGKILSKI